MQIEAARAIVKLLLDESARLNEFLALQDGVAPDDFDCAKQIVGSVMATIYLDGLHPLLREHPSLKLDGLDT